ncbi:MAG: hypothetical protein LBE18_06615 [Planctomycetaceae bacterium]|jgi:hypothetical protein|nr:hypothetical protein [Planctomycetaceae bacterium]
MNCTVAPNAEVCIKAYRQAASGTNPKPWDYFMNTDQQCVTNDSSCYEKSFGITSDCNPVSDPE